MSFYRGGSGLILFPSRATWPQLSLSSGNWLQTLPFFPVTRIWYSVLPSSFLAPCLTSAPWADGGRKEYSFAIIPMTWRVTPAAPFLCTLMQVGTQFCLLPCDKLLHTNYFYSPSPNLAAHYSYPDIVLLDIRQFLTVPVLKTSISNTVDR